DTVGPDRVAPFLGNHVDGDATTREFRVRAAHLVDVFLVGAVVVVRRRHRPGIKTRRDVHAVDEHRHVAADRSGADHGALLHGRGTAHVEAAHAHTGQGRTNGL